MKTKWLLPVLFLLSLIIFYFKWEEPVGFPCLVPSSLACWEYRTLLQAVAAVPVQQLSKTISPETSTRSHRQGDWPVCCAAGADQGGTFCFGFIQRSFPKGCTEYQQPIPQLCQCPKHFHTAYSGVVILENHPNPACIWGVDLLAK